MRLPAVRQKMRGDGLRAKGFDGSTMHIEQRLGHARREEQHTLFGKNAQHIQPDREWMEVFNEWAQSLMIRLNILCLIHR